MKTLKTLAAFAVLSGVSAQTYASFALMVPAGFYQPYNNQRASFVSTVQSCVNPVPMPLAAADDFWFNDNFLVNHFRWWGTVSNPAQRFRTYYIAIYQDAGCQPGNLVFEACLVPMTAPQVAVDCEGRNVYNFYAGLAAPLQLPAGHYWFRVAESDADSINQGAVDFRWSGRRPIRACPAGQHNAAGAWLSPLVDPCDQMNDDLAFCVLG